MKKVKYLILSGFILLFTVIRAQEVTNEFQARTGFKLLYSPIKKLNLYVTPEVRFDENFAVNKYLVEAEARYKFSKMFALGANYRFVINPRDAKDTEYYSRYAVYAKLKKKFGDFEPSLRFAYANYSDDDDENDHFLRYKASLNYNIPNCKITPVVSAEAFQNLSLKEFSKMRYSIGADYKLFKKNYIGVKYKFDYYRLEYKNRHIISLEYKIKL